MSTPTLPAALLALPDITISSLVRDVILYGQDDLDEVLASNDLTYEEFMEIAETPAFKKAAEDLGNELKSSGLVKVKARDILNEQLHTLRDIANNTGQEASDRIKAVELIAKIADALPKNTGSTQTGPMVTINLGSLQKDNIIEAN